MNILKNLFNKEKRKVATKEDLENADFFIQHYPKVNRYVVKYKNKKYFQSRLRTIELTDFIDFATFYMDQKQAKKAIEKFQKQNLYEN